MPHSISLPDAAYERLQLVVKRRGYATLEEYLAQWAEAETNRSRATLEEIDRLREEMTAKYGPFADSTPLIREDRDR